MQSPFYFLLETLIRTKGDILKNFTVTSNAKQDAFYVELTKLKNPFPLFSVEQFDFASQHLTFNKEYIPNIHSEKAFGLRIAHYTEKYQNRTGEDFYKARLYLNHAGHLLEIQFKHYQNKEDKQGCEYKISKEQEALFSRQKIYLKQNANPFITFLKKIMHLHQEKLNSLESEISNYNSILIKFSKSFPKTIEKYEKIAYLFSQKIQEINYLKTNSFDQRDKRVFEVLENAKLAKNLMAKRALLIQAQLESNLSENTEQDPIELDRLKTVNTQLKLEKQKIKQQIESLAQKITLKLKNSVTQLANKNALLEQLNVAIMHLYCFSNQTSKEKVQEDKLIEKAQNNIMLLKEKINETYIEALYQGNVEKIKILFFAGDCFSKDIYFKLLNEISTKLNENLKEVCKFLIQNSQNYRIALEGLENCFIKWRDHYLISFIGRLMIEKNLNAFCFFLEQNFDPNGIGLIAYEGTVSLLKFAIIMNKPEFAQILIDKGALIEQWNNTNLSDFLKTSPLEKKYSLENMQHRIFEKKIMPNLKFFQEYKVNFSKILTSLSAGQGQALNIYYMSLSPSCLFLANYLPFYKETFNLQAPVFNVKDLIKRLLELSDLAHIALSVVYYQTVSERFTQNLQSFMTFFEQKIKQTTRQEIELAILKLHQWSKQLNLLTPNTVNQDVVILKHSILSASCALLRKNYFLNTTTLTRAKPIVFQQQSQENVPKDKPKKKKKKKFNKSKQITF